MMTKEEKLKFWNIFRVTLSLSLSPEPALLLRHMRWRMWSGRSVEVTCEDCGGAEEERGVVRVRERERRERKRETRKLQKVISASHDVASFRSQNWYGSQEWCVFLVISPFFFSFCLPLSLSFSLSFFSLSPPYLSSLPLSSISLITQHYQPSECYFRLF